MREPVTAPDELNSPEPGELNAEPQEPEPRKKTRPTGSGILKGLSKAEVQQWKRANLARARDLSKEKRARHRAEQIRRSLIDHEVSLAPETLPGRMLADVRDTLTDDQGANLTAARRMLIDSVAMSALILKVLDGWLLRCYTKGSGSVAPDDLPILAERRATAGLLGSQLKMLGLTRHAKQVETLTDYLERSAEERAARQREEEEEKEEEDSHGEEVRPGS